MEDSNVENIGVSSCWSVDSFVVAFWVQAEMKIKPFESLLRGPKRRTRTPDRSCASACCVCVPWVTVAAATVRGLEVWRVEKFKVVRWPAKKYGKFFGAR